MGVGLEFVREVFGRVPRWVRTASGRAIVLLPALLVGASVASTAFMYPHTLGYFNELAGGPRNGHRHLIHSSLDWGQDLLLLKEQVAALGPSRPVYLVCHGHYRAADLELPTLVPSSVTLSERGGPEPGRRIGLCAISINALCGDERPTVDRGGVVRDAVVLDRVPMGRIASLPRVGASLVVLPCVDLSGDEARPEDGDEIEVFLGGGSEVGRD